MDTACHFTGCIEAGDRLAVLIQDLSIGRNLQTTHGVMDRRCTRSSIERRFNDRTIKELSLIHICFREGPNFLVIDPDECIDCAVCIPECPTNAIMAEEDVPEDQQEFIALNAELARVWPSITRMKPHTDEAEKWRDVLDKRQYLKKEL